jgi:N utilization substance protein A
LAIGKKGQNVRLATRLVGWDINIISEDVIKKEIAQQMGKMMASGEAVPLTALQGVSAAQADDLKDKGISDVEALAATSVDDLVDILDVSLDEAEKILSAAKAVVDASSKQSDEESVEEVEVSDEVVSEEETENPVDESVEAPAEAEASDEEK